MRGPAPTLRHGRDWERFVVNLKGDSSPGRTYVNGSALRLFVYKYEVFKDLCACAFVGVVGAALGLRSVEDLPGSAPELLAQRPVVQVHSAETYHVGDVAGFLVVVLLVVLVLLLLVLALV